MSTFIKIHFYLQANNVEGATEALAHLRPFTEMKYSEIIKDAWAFADPKETSLVLLNHGFVG